MLTHGFLMSSQTRRCSTGSGRPGHAHHNTVRRLGAPPHPHEKIEEIRLFTTANTLT